MPIDISDLISPEHTAVALNECQHGILGPSSSLPAIAEAARWILPNAGRLVGAARSHGVPVLHTVAKRRPDGRGARGGFISRHTQRTTPDLDLDLYSQVMPEIGIADSDFIVPRFGGMGGFSASGAISILRGLEVRTVILGGVTLNAGVLSMMVYALDEGFDVVVASDASSGYPREYGDQVLLRSIRPFSPIVTVADIVDTWNRVSPRSS